MGFTLYQVTEYLPASSVKDGHVKLVPTNFSYSLESQGRSVSQITLFCDLYPTILRLFGQNFKQFFLFKKVVSTQPKKARFFELHFTFSNSPMHRSHFVFVKHQIKNLLAKISFQLNGTIPQTQRFLNSK